MSVNKPTNEEVFIVDDDPMVLNALTIVLSRAGYQVTGFADGASFLAAAKSRTPICVILDVHMPGRSGLDILKELNAQQYPRADLHHFRPRRHPDGGRGDQERRVRFHREAVRRLRPW